MPKTMYVLVAVVILLCQSLYGQSEQPGKPAAFKFAEFTKIKPLALTKTMEAFCTELKKTMEHQGFIINYGSTSEIQKRPSEIVGSTRSCWVEYDGTRVTFVGPEEKQIRSVLWIVPPGAENPQP